MEASDITFLAEEFLFTYREVLLIDPFYTIDITIGKGDYISRCIISDAPLTWTVELNPEKHAEAEDVQFSIIESLLKVLFADLDKSAEKDPQYDRSKNGIISRLTNVLSAILPLDFSDENEDDLDGESFEDEE